MKLKNGILNLINRNRLVDSIFFLVPLIGVMHKYLLGDYNNYKIYKGVFYHTRDCLNLYNTYPTEYFDKNHYGILYSLIIAPFTYLPDVIGVVLYQLLQIAFLWWVVRKLPIAAFKQNGIMLYVMLESLANAQNSQTNTFIGATIIGSYVFLNRKTWLGVFFMLLGTFIKLYSIVALGLFLFVKQKARYIFLIVAFAIGFYFAPLFITKWSCVNQSYIDWWIELGLKNETNSDVYNMHQGISFVGMLQRVFHPVKINLKLVILAALFLQALPILRRPYFNSQLFQLRFLATILLFPILFNTATEASTHVIGALGIGVWWATQANYLSRSMMWTLIVCLIIGTLSTTDLVPALIRNNFVRAYAIKSLPYFIIWCFSIWQLLRMQYTTIPYEQEA